MAWGLTFGRGDVFIDYGVQLSRDLFDNVGILGPEQLRAQLPHFLLYLHDVKVTALGTCTPYIKILSRHLNELPYCDVVKSIASSRLRLGEFGLVMG